MITRLGEIILVQYPEIIVELYSDSVIDVGQIIATEDGMPIGIVHTVVAVCIEEGKATQALGQTDFTDATLQEHYPHLKNSTRKLAKVWLYDGISNLNLNQGIYSTIGALTICQEKTYWHCLTKVSLTTVKKHIDWLKSSTPNFEIKDFIKTLSLTNKKLAWELFMDQFAY